MRAGGSRPGDSRREKARALSGQIDCHAHVFSQAGRFSPDARYRPSHDARVEDWFALQKPAGITHGVLVQPSFLGTDNTQLLHALEVHPQRLRGVVAIEPEVDIGTLERWDALGVRGVRLNLWRTREQADYAAPEWRLLFGSRCGTNCMRASATTSA